MKTILLFAALDLALFVITLVLATRQMFHRLGCHFDRITR